MLLSIVKAKTEQGKDIDFVSTYELSENLYADRGYKVINPVNIKGTMNYQGDKLYLNAKVKFNLQVVCDNCGIDFTKEIAFDFEEVFIENYASHSDEDYLINQTCVELDKPLNDCILLNTPTRMLCKESCKGLCPICGKNKNVSTCACESLKEETENYDNPFKDLKNNNLL